MNNYPTGQYIDQRLNMTWPLICLVACQAMILNITFEEMVASSMRAQMTKQGSEL